MDFIDALSPCWIIGKSCIPRWEAWAAVGAIFAGVATLLAVWASFRTGNKALAAVERQRADDARAIREEKDANARSLAAALFEEIYDYGNHMSAVHAELGFFLRARDAGKVVEVWDAALPNGALPLLNRYALELGVLDKEIRRELLGLLSAWLSVKEQAKSPSIRGVGNENFWQAAEAVHSRFGCEVERSTRTVSALYARTVGERGFYTRALPRYGVRGEWLIWGNVERTREGIQMQVGARNMISRENALFRGNCLDAADPADAMTFANLNMDLVEQVTVEAGFEMLDANPATA